MWIHPVNILKTLKTPLKKKHSQLIQVYGAYHDKKTQRAFLLANYTTKSKAQLLGLALMLLADHTTSNVIMYITGDSRVCFAVLLCESGTCGNTGAFSEISAMQLVPTFHQNLFGVAALPRNMPDICLGTGI